MKNLGLSICPYKIIKMSLESRKVYTQLKGTFNGALPSP